MQESHREFLSDEKWTLLQRLAPVRYRASRATLLRQDEPASCVVLLETGSVMVTADGPRGSEQLLAVRGNGELLGEMSVLAEGVRSATVRTLEPCQVRVVPAVDFTDFIESHGLLRPLLRHSYSRLREADRTKLELATGSVALRLSGLLMRLSGPATPNGPSRIRLPQEDLARLIGASRNAVGKVLKEWSRHGWLTTAPGGGVTVTDVRALRAHAAEQ
ncbi:Crp/Fnr family transcriptional regulator [Kitasatospora sp. NPDC127116]|uniref:Crp/Fnr family transcriptional regulator n=1 Tax=unclassified Kitasatospora TaxID=2633591 RepID=UPI00363DFFC0